jgi:hypothetical protein
MPRVKMLVSAVAIAALPLAGYAATDEAVAACRAIKDSGPRLACYDALPVASVGVGRGAAPAPAPARPAAPPKWPRQRRTRRHALACPPRAARRPSSPSRAAWSATSRGGSRNPHPPGERAGVAGHRRDIALRRPGSPEGHREARRAGLLLPRYRGREPRTARAPRGLASRAGNEKGARRPLFHCGVASYIFQVRPTRNCRPRTSKSEKS